MADTRGEHVESNCPFCDRKQFEERLVAEVDGFYIIATLGQITDGGYVLLFPKGHISCMGVLSEEQAVKMFSISAEIAAVLLEEYVNRPSEFLPLTAFEHGIVGQTVKHAHFHILPAAFNLTPKISRDFLGTFIEQIELMELQSRYKEHPRPYLYWVSGADVDDSVKRNYTAIERVCWNPPAPAQYLRVIAAEALGRPERANWRTMDPELDKQLWSETVRRLKPYFA